MATLPTEKLQEVRIRTATREVTLYCEQAEALLKVDLDLNVWGSTFTLSAEGTGRVRYAVRRPWWRLWR